MGKLCLNGTTGFVFALLISMLLFSKSTVTGQTSILFFELPYTEDFNTLINSGTGTTVPPGWAFAESGTNMNSTYTAGTGSANTGDTYSYGAAGSTERAFGGIQSGNLNPTIGASFTNNTGDTIHSFTFSFTGEQWRIGTLGRVDRLDFQYSTNATSLITGAWIDHDPLDFVAPTTTGSIGALNGNIAPNRTLVESTITSLAIPNGSTFWIRWNDFNGTGADDGLSVDDFSIAACSDPFSCSLLPIQLLHFSVIKAGTNTRIKWSTSIEINNERFEIQRSDDGISSFLPIGTVESTSNFRSLNNYEFIDQTPSIGNNYYRLKQYDLDGKFTFSPVRSITMSENQFSVLISPNPVTDFIQVEFPSANHASEITLFDHLGRVVLKEQLATGQSKLKLMVHDFPVGIYTILVVSGFDRDVQRLIIAN